MDVGLPHNLPRRYDYGEEDWVADPVMHLEVTHIGDAVEGTQTGIIQTSYNAG